MKYIIMCGGQYPDWTGPRQLTPIFGEALVARTIRLLRDNDVKDIAISTNDDRFARFGLPLLKHFNEFSTDGQGCWAQGFYLMDEPVCYIMGDVIFSPEAIRTIVTTPVESVQFFASAPPFSPHYVKLWAEPFAFKVVDHKKFSEAVNFLIANENTGIFQRRPIAWELWQVLNNEDINDINFDNYVVINDYTCDIDKPDDVAKIERAMIWM